MDPKYTYQKQKEMIQMHDFFLGKIDTAISESRNIEAVWLIYACMENRLFRTLEKSKKQCSYSKGKCKKTDNQISISTKIACLQRLREHHVSCIEDSFPETLFDNIKKWIKQRDKLMHNLLVLENYANVENKFANCANEGRTLLLQLYDSCTKFRTLFFSDSYIFEFPKEAMNGCRCKPNNT